MALGASHDFSMHSGDDLVLEVTVKDASGAVVNITGATGTFGIGKLDSSGNPKGAPLATARSSTARSRCRRIWWSKWQLRWKTARVSRTQSRMLR